MERFVYPFSAIVGQDKMKLALILNAIHPAIGGVLIRGERAPGNRRPYGRWLGCFPSWQSSPTVPTDATRTRPRPSARIARTGWPGVKRFPGGAGGCESLS